MSSLLSSLAEGAELISSIFHILTLVFSDCFPLPIHHLDASFLGQTNYATNTIFSHVNMHISEVESPKRNSQELGPQSDFWRFNFWSVFWRSLIHFDLEQFLGTRGRKQKFSSLPFISSRWFCIALHIVCSKNILLLSDSPALHWLNKRLQFCDIVCIRTIQLNRILSLYCHETLVKGGSKRNDVICLDLLWYI